MIKEIRRRDEETRVSGGRVEGRTERGGDTMRGKERKVDEKREERSKRGRKRTEGEGRRRRAIGRREWEDGGTEER